MSLKNINTLYFKDTTKIIFVMLPRGYFYKCKYHTVAGCYKALKKDGEVDTHKYTNGSWRFGDKLYRSLKELYECEMDEIAMSYIQFKKNYKKYGISFNPSSRVYYSYDRDESRELFDSKEIAIENLSFYVNNTKFLADTEEYEDKYIDTLTKEECISYFKKPIKERIAVLEKWGRELLCKQ